MILILILNLYDIDKNPNLNPWFVPSWCLQVLQQPLDNEAFQKQVNHYIHYITYNYLQKPCSWRPSSSMINDHADDDDDDDNGGNYNMIRWWWLFQASVRRSGSGKHNSKRSHQFSSGAKSKPAPRIAFSAHPSVRPYVAFVNPSYVILCQLVEGLGSHGLSAEGTKDEVTGSIYIYIDF